MRSKPTALGSLSVVGLIVLALLAVSLSTAAILKHREATPGTPISAVPTTQTVLPTISEASSPSTEPSSTPPGAAGSPTPTAPSPTSVPESTVVIIGDSNSMGNAQGTWAEGAAQALGWDEIVNLSAPGRGFFATPRSCDFTPCSTFSGSIDLISNARPSIVITFGGTADGDVALGEAASSYFENLREALPDAELIAISPVTGADEWPYFMTMHQQSIRAAVEGVGGTMIDVGRVGLGEDPLSAESHAEIAQVVVDELG